MIGTWRVLRAEWFRLLRSRVTHLSALFVFLVPVLHVAAARFVDSAERLEAVRSGRKVLGLEQGRGWAPLVEAWRVGLALGALLLLIHGARAVAGDRENGVLRLASTRTAARPALAMGRALLGPPLVGCVVLLSGLGAWLTARLWFDFGPLVEDGYLILEVGELRHELLRALASAIPALWAVHAFGLLISALSRGATLAVATSVALFLAFDLFKGALGQNRFWAFASYSPSFVDNSAMQELVGVAHGYSDAGFPEALMRMSYLLPAPQGFLFVILAALVLTRRRL
jgi:ABC-type transport system involved in multi-copper enzyme maturation permease subunit